MRQRQANGQEWVQTNIRIPIAVYEFIKTQSHAENLSMSAYVARVFAEKKKEILGKKS